MSVSSEVLALKLSLNLNTALKSWTLSQELLLLVQTYQFFSVQPWMWTPNLQQLIDQLLEQHWDISGYKNSHSQVDNPLAWNYLFYMLLQRFPKGYLTWEDHSDIT